MLESNNEQTNEQINKTTPKPKAKPQPRKYKHTKVFNEEKGKFVYKAPSEYYREYYHRAKQPKTCEICGSTVISQMCIHRKGKFCKMLNELAELQSRVENIKVED